MEAIAPSINVLETLCYPPGCTIDREHQVILAFVNIPNLYGAGMTLAQINAATLLKAEPHLTKLKSIVCRGCGHYECVNNPKAGQDSMLGQLLQCKYAERQKKNGELVAALLPTDKVAEWEARGIKLWHYIMSSRTRVYMSLKVTVGEVVTDIWLRYKEGEKVITVWTDPHVKFPLPTTVEEIRTLLEEIVESLAK